MMYIIQPFFRSYVLVIFIISICTVSSAQTSFADLTSPTLTATTTPTNFGTKPTTLLRPSANETITAGHPYTIRWPKSTASGNLAIEVRSYAGRIDTFVPNSTTCDGWLINTECDKFNLSLPDGSTSYVWNLTDFKESYYFGYGDKPPVQMFVYVDDLDTGDTLGRSPWYAWAKFTVAVPSSLSPAWTRSTAGLSATRTDTRSTPTISEDADSSTQSSIAMKNSCIIEVWKWGVLFFLPFWFI